LAKAGLALVASSVFDPDLDKKSLATEDMELIRNVPGVHDAIATNSFPLRGGGWSMSLQHEPGEGTDGIGVAIYFVDEHAIETYGTNLIDGRNFSPNEIAWNDPEKNTWPDTGIISKAMAEALFPDEAASAVGKTVYINDDKPVKIIGIVDRLQAPWNGWDRIEHSMLVPMLREYDEARYVIRTDPGYRDLLMPQIEQLLAESNQGRIIRQVRTMEQVRNRSYNGDAAMIKILTFIVTLLTAITGLGIVGLASFGVTRRTRQIGVRRALGATRPQIVRHFMVENFIISGMGVVGGAILAVGLNMLMVHTFAITPLSWYVVPAAMIVLWIVGQIAVAGPARRASLITPAIATRSV
jgi:putative ABC transport system permease protein